MRVKEHSLNPLRPDRLVLPSKQTMTLLDKIGCHEQQLTDEFAVPLRRIVHKTLRKKMAIMTKEIALQLSQRVGMSPEFWMCMPEDKIFNSRIVATAGPKRRLTRHGLRD